MTKKKRKYNYDGAVVECAMEGCTNVFKKRGGRHKFCDTCQPIRRRQYNHEWYYERGGKEKVKAQYHADPDKYRARARESYKKRGKWNPTPAQRENRRKWNAELVQLKRERRIKEMEEGGRKFRKRNAPTSAPYLTGVAAYGARGKQLTG